MCRVTLELAEIGGVVRLPTEHHADLNITGQAISVQCRRALNHQGVAQPLYRLIMLKGGRFSHEWYYARSRAMRYFTGILAVDRGNAEVC